MKNIVVDQGNHQAFTDRLPDYFDWQRHELHGEVEWEDETVHPDTDWIRGYCRGLYQDYENRADTVMFILNEEGWNADHVGVHLGENFYGYEVGFVKSYKRYWDTLYHEIMHTVDNIYYRYTGNHLENIVDVREWDEDVVHGRNKNYVEYRYDDVLRQVQPQIDKALRRRRENQNLYMRLAIKLWSFNRWLQSNPEVIFKDGSGDKMDMWAEAIKEFEGWRPGSLTYRLNNPGALRWSPYQDGKKEGFSYFGTYHKGWTALQHQLRIAANGKSSVYRPNMTIREFVDTWAPPSDNNDHNDRYAAYIADKTGETTDTEIKHLIS